MVNLVEITVRATDDTAAGFSAVRAKAAKAGDDAAKAFSTAFKLRADASVHTESGVSGGMFGEDKSFLNKLKSYASTPGGIGIIGTGSDTSLVSTLKHAIQTSAQQGGLGLLGGVGKGAGEINTSDIIKQVIEGNGPSNTSTKDFVDQIMGGNTPGNVNTEDMIRQVLTNNVTGNVSTKDFVKWMDLAISWGGHPLIMKGALVVPLCGTHFPAVDPAPPPAQGPGGAPGLYRGGGLN